MDKDKATWIASIVAGLLGGLGTLTVGVQKAAAQELDRQGAFNGINEENRRAVAGLGLLDPQEKKQAIVGINHTSLAKKRAIMRQKGVHTLSGAWNALASQEKTYQLGFAAVGSILVGAITYGAISQMRKGGDGGGAEDWLWDAGDFGFDF